MKRHLTYLILFLFHGSFLFAQDDIYEDLLKKEVEVENPVYMPVIGIGPGIMRYYGDLKNGVGSPLLGNRAMKINISTFLDNKHFFKTNFFILLLGQVGGDQYTYMDPSTNLNFRSDIFTFGLNLQYSFEHFIPTKKMIHPYISLGIENMSFTSKSDLINSNGELYIYYPDGSLRDKKGNIVLRDYNYESDLRSTVDYGLKSYSQSAIGFPVEFGFNFVVSQRAYVQLGYSYHYLLTDLLDHVSSKNTKGVIGKKGNDGYSYTYITLHYDLFSDAKTMTIKQLFADMEFDATMFDDEDNDMVFDRNDKCFGTPNNIEVDSVGCPFDTDQDGIYDYLDLEKNTTLGAFVNDNGVEMKVNDLLNMLNSEGVKREDVKLILRSAINSKYFSKLTNKKVPNKFIAVDTDEDGYISFEEVLDAIDGFFNNSSEMNANDVYELKDFFFNQ